MSTKISRRDFMKFLFVGAAGTAGAALLKQPGASADGHQHTPSSATPMPHGGGLPGTVGEVDHEKNGFNPTDILTDFDYGEVSTLPDGRTLREFKIISLNKNIEVIPGIEFPAWTYNGRVPGPTIR